MVSLSSSVPGTLLQLELERTAPERVPALHARADGWYRSAGNPIGAMRHALAQPDYAVAADICLENAESLQSTGRFATVEAWMDQLPAAAVTARAAFLQESLRTDVDGADGRSQEPERLRDTYVPKGEPAEGTLNRRGRRRWRHRARQTGR